MMRKPRCIVLAGWIAAAVLSVCSCGGGGGGDDCAALGGNYSGTANDNVLGQGVLVASVLQDGCSIAGSLESCFPNSGCDGGDITGTISGNNFDLTVVIDGSCIDRVQGSINGTTISGNYVRQGCNIGGGGAFMASRSS